MNMMKPESGMAVSVNANAAMVMDGITPRTIV